jgi:hypothetical protein
MQGASKAQQRQLIGAADYPEQPLTVQTARSLLAPMVDSAVSKSEGRLDAKYSTRIDLLETSVGSLETTVTSELRSFKAEMKEVLQSATAGQCRTTSTTALSAAAVEGQGRLAATLRLWQGRRIRQLQRFSTSTSTSTLRSGLGKEANSLLGVWWPSLGEELPSRSEA